MYLISTALVSWNGVKSDQFQLCNGVKHGGVLSPVLFYIYLDPLMQEGLHGIWETFDLMRLPTQTNGGS